MRMKFLPPRDGMNDGKAWVAYDSQELAQKVVQELGGEDGTFEFNGVESRLMIADWERVLKRKEIHNERMRTIYVGNLNFRLEDWQLEDYFIQFGQVNRVHLSKDDTGRSKGFAHVTFENRGDAINAVNEASGAMLEGRAMRTGFANKRPQRN